MFVISTLQNQGKSKDYLDNMSRLTKFIIEIIAFRLPFVIETEAQQFVDLQIVVVVFFFLYTVIIS